MTFFYMDKKASVHWSAARTKSGRRPADAAVINRWSTAVQRGYNNSPTGLHRISLVRASGGTFRTCVFDALEGAKDGFFVGEPIRRLLVLPGRAPPRPAVRRPDPTHPWFVLIFPRHALHEKGLQRQGGGPLVSSQERRAAVVPQANRSLCSPIGLNWISLVRASGGAFGACVFDALGGTRDSFLLGEPFCRRPVLPGPAPPPRRAPPRRDPLMVSPGFGIHWSATKTEGRLPPQ